MSLMTTLYGQAPAYCVKKAKCVVHKHIAPRINRTDKAYNNYLDALKNGPMTVKQLADAAHKEVSTVQRQVRRMEQRELIKEYGRVKNKANPAILWGLA